MPALPALITLITLIFTHMKTAVATASDAGNVSVTLTWQPLCGLVFASVDGSDLTMGITHTNQAL